MPDFTAINYGLLGIFLLLGLVPVWLVVGVAREADAGERVEPEVVRLLAVVVVWPALDGAREVRVFDRRRTWLVDKMAAHVSQPPVAGGVGRHERPSAVLGARRLLGVVHLSRPGA